MSDLYSWIVAGGVVVVGLITAWFSGRSKGKAVVREEQARADIAASQAAAKRETTVSREAAHVDQSVNNSSDADVDKQLRDKWTRPGSR